jgi:hypothetical protein
MRGQLGANTYQMTFPGQQQVPVGVQQQQLKPEQFDLGKDPLAIREKLTSDLYNAKALLDAVAKDFSSQGIDPFTPDYSQDGGGLAFQTLEKAKANLMYAADALRLQAEADEKEREAYMRGDIRYTSGYDPTTDMSTQMNPADVYYSTQLDPRTVAANQRTAQNVYTQRDANNLNRQVYDPTYKALGQSGFSPEEQAYQQSALLKSVPETSYQQLIDRSGGRGGSQNTPEIEVLKKVTNLAQGVWPEGTYNVITKGGKALLENRTMSGEYLGDYIGQDAKGNQKVFRKIVKRWIKDPETGEVIIEFDNADIPAEVVSNTKGDVIASSIISNNPKYGSAQKMYATARELGYLDDTSSAINEALIPQNADAIRNNIKEKGKAKSAAIKQRYDQVKNQITDLDGGFFEVSDGRVLKVKKHRFKDKYYIDGWEDLYEGSSADKFENLTVEQVLDKLDDFGYFDMFLDEQAPVQQPVQAPKIVNQGGKKAY